MNKLPPIAKVYEALSAVADQRVEMHADHAIVTSSDHTKDYTVKFLPDGYSSTNFAWTLYCSLIVLKSSGSSAAASSAIPAALALRITAMLS